MAKKCGSYFFFWYACVELITKTREEFTGNRYFISGGIEKEFSEVGAPEGTTFLVRDLFYNTPARKKFLKSAVTEAGYISDLMERFATSHPEVAYFHRNRTSAGINRIFYKFFYNRSRAFDHLASASVAVVELITKTREEFTGNRYFISGGIMPPRSLC